MEIWQTILIAVGGSAALLAVPVAILGFLAKSLLLNSLSKDLEGFKNGLKIKAIEHQTRFSGLHEKRAVILAEAFSYFREPV